MRTNLLICGATILNLSGLIALGSYTSYLQDRAKSASSADQAYRDLKEAERREREEGIQQAYRKALAVEAAHKNKVIFQKSNFTEYVESERQTLEGNIFHMKALKEEEETRVFDLRERVTRIHNLTDKTRPIVDFLASCPQGPLFCWNELKKEMGPCFKKDRV